jgi:molybdopterin-guanine dinucleotide biosynthesis protein A
VKREGRFGNVAGAVLVGGASTRMGEDKSRATLGGVPLATRVARTLEDVVEDLILVGGDPPPDAPGRRVPDGAGPQCALRGLVAALSAVETERLLVVATDLPLVTPALLLALLAAPDADAVVPAPPDGLQPLCAVYRTAPTLERARANLAAERLALHTLLDELDVFALDAATLAELDPAGIALANLNTPAERADAEARIAVGSR